MLRQDRHPHLWLLAAALTSAAILGCNSPKTTAPVTDSANLAPPLPNPLFNNQPMEAVTDANPRPTDAYTLMVRLRIIPVDVPIGQASNSERLWSYFNEDVPGRAAASVLNRNGFRVGRAHQDNWPAIRRLLREMTGNAVAESHFLAKPGQPVSLVLKENQEIQPIFAFNQRGELTGYDYPPGDNVLILACHLNEDNPSAVTLQAVPLIRSTFREQKYVKTETGYMLKNEPTLFPLDGLEFTVPMPQGSYLIIGPGTMIYRETSPGRRFLLKSRDGLQFETVLIVVPEVFAAPLVSPVAPDSSLTGR